MKAVAALLMTVQLAGCTYWKVETVSPVALIENHQPDVLRVQSGDGRRQLLYEPAIRGDSLVGTSSYDSKRQNRSVALAGVTRVETHHVSANRTVAMIMGIAAVVAAAGLIAVSQMQGL